jgi:RHS repeat-associated protein
MRTPTVITPTAACAFSVASGAPPHSTGKERDTESGNDYFLARYYGSSMGRFLSPDPIAGTLANPQSLNRYVYVLNNPLVLTDPTGMIVDWEDSDKGDDGKTNDQRAYEKRIDQLLGSKSAKDRKRGAGLQKTYQRLQDSKATFEVTNGNGNNEGAGDIEYNGNDHFTINLSGSDASNFSTGQKTAHEFEHGRQVLDGELSFQQGADGKWKPYAYDDTDEAKAYAASFEFEGAAPGQGKIINDVATQLTFGVAAGAQYLHDHVSHYSTLPVVPINVPNPAPPNVYQVPK